MLNLYKKMKGSEQGSVVIFVAIMLPIFMLCMVLAIDASKGQAAKTRMASVQDAVGFAYASTPQEMLDRNNITRKDYALRFSQLNLSDGDLGADYRVNISSTTDIVETSSEAKSGKGKPYFAAAAGVSQNALGAGSASKIQKNSSSATTTAPTLLSLVLDGSGSMDGVNIYHLRDAVRNLANSVLKNNSDKGFWISQIVYSEIVDRERDFSNSHLTVLNWVNDIVARGMTCGSCGLQRAKELLDAKILSDVKYASYNKVVVFMTDGHMNKGDLHLPQCTVFKNAGYTVYGVSFSDWADKDKVRACASPGKYYHADHGAMLSEIFNAIVTKIIRVRMIE